MVEHTEMQKHNSKEGDKRIANAKQKLHIENLAREEKILMRMSTHLNIADEVSEQGSGSSQVTMSRAEDAFMAVREPNPCIDGRKANVNLAILGAKPRSMPAAYLQALALQKLQTAKTGSISATPQIPDPVSPVLLSMPTSNVSLNKQVVSNPAKNYLESPSSILDSALAVYSPTNKINLPFTNNTDLTSYLDISPGQSQALMNPDLVSLSGLRVPTNLNNCVQPSANNLQLLMSSGYQFGLPKIYTPNDLSSTSPYQMNGKTSLSQSSNDSINKCGNLLANEAAISANFNFNQTVSGNPMLQPWQSSLYPFNNKSLQCNSNLYLANTLQPQISSDKLKRPADGSLNNQS